jgi:DNA mismatch endonuclease (patch repair protein)
LQAVIFVHGCFWHAHRCRRGRKEPRSNVQFWREKRRHNRERDRKIVGRLRRRGWRVLVVWECETKQIERLRARVGRFLSHSNRC